MSPLELFRRNNKVMMTGLIMLAMFAFVVLPAVTVYMRRSGPGVSDPVLAEFNGVSLTASRVNGFTQQHYKTVRYLERLAEETMRRGGTPQVVGFNYDQRTQSVQAVGINGSPSDEMSIRTLQFAAEAEEQGFELDDTALRNWLEMYTGGTFSDREIFALLRNETNNSMGQFQLYDMLRKQLLSNLYFRGASATVSRGQFPLQSPLDHWHNFLRLNQKATVDTYAVLVNDFVDKVDATPTPSEINAVYEDGKDRYPFDQSPDPGFRRYDSAKFEFVVADLESFRETELAKLSDEEIKAEYERQIMGGAFKLPEEAPIEEEAEVEEAEVEMKSDEGDANEAKPNEPKEADEPKESEPVSEKSDKPAELNEPAEASGDDKPAEDAKPEMKEAEEVKGESTSEPAEEPAKEDAPAKEEESDPAAGRTFAWRCTVCGHIEYVDELPEDFICPICGVGRDLFERIEL